MKKSLLLIFLGILMGPTSSYAEIVYKCEADYKVGRLRNNQVSQTLRGHYLAYGADCGKCFAAGRNEARSGGWIIIFESNPVCDPVLAI